MKTALLGCILIIVLNFVPIRKLKWYDEDDPTPIDFRYQYDSVNALVKHQTLNFSDFLASVGGLIGLIAGVSVISLIEFLYHFIVYLLSFRPSKRLFTRVHPTEAERNAANVLPLNQTHALYQCSKYFFEFIRESSIHGLVYTTKNDEKLVGRICWSFVLVSSSITCGFLIMDNLSHAELNPVTLQIDAKIWKADEVNLKA